MAFFLKKKWIVLCKGNIFLCIIYVHVWNTILEIMAVVYAPPFCMNWWYQWLEERGWQWIGRYLLTKKLKTSLHFHWCSVVLLMSKRAWVNWLSGEAWIQFIRLTHCILYQPPLHFINHSRGMLVSNCGDTGLLSLL